MDIDVSVAIAFIYSYKLFDKCDSLRLIACLLPCDVVSSLLFVSFLPQQVLYNYTNQGLSSKSDEL